MPSANSKQDARPPRQHGRTRKYLAPATLLVAATSLLAQVSAEHAALSSPTAAGLSPTAEPSSSAHTVVTAQQRVLRYNSGRDPSAPAGPDQPASGEESSRTLHLLVGRSLFVSSSQRLRKVYVSNPAVLDSFTASPYQLVI